MKKMILSLGIVLGIFVTLGSVSAASEVETIQPAEVMYTTEEVVIDRQATMRALTVTGVINLNSGVRINGVTYFNGTMANNTTTSGVNNPITIGDTLRVDDYIYRREVGGTNNLKVADTIQPYLNGTYDLGTQGTVGTYKFRNLYLTQSVYANNADFSGDIEARGADFSGEIHGTSADFSETIFGTSIDMDGVIYASGGEFTGDIASNHNVIVDNSIIVENLISDGDEASALNLDSIINIEPSDGAPYSCNSSHTGDIIFSTTVIGGGNNLANNFYGCNGTSWYML